MRYLSVCSGIEAATVAWHPLGWTPAAFSEIEPFPSSVLAHHYPTVPNLGDITKFKNWNLDAIDLLVGGTPCQSFSVAGLRKGLADPRGNLMLTYLAIADRYRPKWLVWENVPGVLSSNGGKDFGTFLGGLAELGYGFAYRILDAQHCGVPQRRRRVFVVGCLGDWRSAAAVLFERHSMQGHPAPCREAGQDVTRTISSRTSSGGGLGTDFECAGGLRAVETLCVATGQAGAEIGADMTPTLNCNHEAPYVAAYGIRTANTSSNGWGIQEESTHTLDGAMGIAVAHTLRGEVFDASEDGTGRGTPLVPIAFNLRGRDGGAQLEVDPTGMANIRAASGGSSRTMVAHAIQAGALRQNPNSVSGGVGVQANVAYTLEARSEVQCAHVGMALRRLLPRECERLQGFRDDYTMVLHRGKPAADGPRYKALGNSMAVPCMRWIGERIDAVSNIQIAD